MSIWNRRVFELTMTIVMSFAASFMFAGCQHQVARTDRIAAFTPNLKLDCRLQAFDFEGVEKAVAAMPAGAARDYYAGIMANRHGHYAVSITLLDRTLPGLRQAYPGNAATALEALGYDESQMGRYADAARDDSDLLEHFGGRLDATHRQGIADDLGVWKAMAGSRPQTVASAGLVRLRTKRDALGDVDAELSVHGVPGSWLLDTGANQSAVSETFARRLGLHFLPGTAETQSGITGVENPIHLAVLDEMHIGGTVVKNIALLVLPDANLHFHFPGKDIQLEAILGFPVLQALGTVTFTQNGELIAGALPTAVPGSAQMYMDGASPLLQASVDGKLAIFSLDTGASGSDLSTRFYKSFPEKRPEMRQVLNIQAEAGGNRRARLSVLPLLRIQVGNEIATLRNVAVHDNAAGTGFDDLYGNLGQNLWVDARAFTMDFAHMRFSLAGQQP